MGGEEGTCNGDGLEPNWAINIFKNEALNNGFGNGVGHDGGEGSSGASDVFRTYKRRRRARSVSDSKLHEDRRASVEAASQLADQTCWRNVVLENMYQSLSDDEGGIQGCIQDALSFHPVIDCMETVKEFEASDKVGLKSSLQRKRLTSGVPNGTHVGAMENGLLHESNHCTITEKCRHTFFNIVISEKFTSLSKLLFENFQGIKADNFFNLKIINSRMKDGAYENSPMLFMADVHQVWKNIQAIGTEMTSLAKSLSDTSRTFYNEQFCMQEIDFNVKPEQAEACCVYKVCTCRHCGERADGTNCLVCDSCEEMYHVSCIEPAVEEIPPKSWYCDRCTASGIGSPHENCVVCERLNAASTLINQGVDQLSLADEEVTNVVEENSHCSTDDVPQPLEGMNNMIICKICGSEIQNHKFRICEHPFCPSKCYHVRCLTNKQKKSYGPHWYCPSCLCRACLTDRDDDKIVLCDGCDNAYHIYCMNPPCASIPKGNWFCRKCDAGIQRIRKAKRAYDKIEKKQKKKSEDSKRAFGKLERELNDECAEESDKGGGGMDMLLNAAKTLNYEEKLAAIQMKDIKGT